MRANWYTGSLSRNLIQETSYLMMLHRRCSPVACDAVTEAVDAVAGDAAIGQHLLCHVQVYGLQCRQRIALHLQANAQVPPSARSKPAMVHQERCSGVCHQCDSAASTDEGDFNLYLCSCTASACAGVARLKLCHEM